MARASIARSHGGKRSPVRSATIQLTSQPKRSDANSASHSSRQDAPHAASARMVVLDTDHLSILQRGSGAAADRLRTHLTSVPEEELATTIVTYEEQMRGWMGYLSRAKSLVAQVEAYSRLLRHLEGYRRIPVLPFDQQSAVEYQRLRRTHP